MIILSATELTKNFGGLAALNHVSVQVQEGEMLGIIGPNGSGKSTLFAVVSGFLRPTAGQVTFLGQRIDGLRPHSICRLGLVRTFQQSQLFSRLTVFQNVLTGAYRSCNSRRTAEAETIRILERLGLDDSSDELAINLNLPDQRKLELAKALSTKPKVLLADEIMGGLRKDEVEEISKLLISLNSREGLTLLMVEHHVKVITAICQRVMVLHHGNTIAEGPPQEIIRDPEVVKAYLGEGEEPRGRDDVRG